MRRPVVLFLAVALVLAALATPLVLPAGALDRVESLALVGARRCSEDACPEGPVRPREADPVIVLLFRGPPSQDIPAARGSEFLGREVPWKGGGRLGRAAVMTRPVAAPGVSDPASARPADR